MNHNPHSNEGRSRPRQLKNPPASHPTKIEPGCGHWTVRRVATYFDTTPKRIYQLIEQGRLETIRLGPRSLRVSRDSIQQFLEQCGQLPDD